MKIIEKPSTHHDERRDGAKPVFLVLHYTETQGPDVADAYFMGRKAHPGGGRVSAHYMVDEDGTVTRYVAEGRRAWHAGVSHWDGIDDVNSSSIGIELVNPGRKYGYRPFPSEQMEALLVLCKGILSRHDIQPHHVIAHSDVAPARKVDPGELFDWQMLADNDIGAWPVPLKEDFEKASSYVADEKQLKDALEEYGYGPDNSLTDLVTAFQRHFCPEDFKNPESVGNPNQEMAARLHYLLRMKRGL